MIWFDMIWSDMIWYDMIWYDMIWYDMGFLSAAYWHCSAISLMLRCKLEDYYIIPN